MIVPLVQVRAHAHLALVAEVDVQAGLGGRALGGRERGVCRVRGGRGGLRTRHVRSRRRSDAALHGTAGAAAALHR